MAIRKQRHLLRLDPLFDTITGTAGADTLTGTAGRDTIDGLSGKDVIYGLGGKDRLDGDNGADTLIGGKGGDKLIGGNEDDVFLFEQVSDSRPDEPDRIFGYNDEDRIDVSAIDADKLTLGDQLFAYVPELTGEAGQLAWSSNGKKGTIIEGDNDGDGIADFRIEIRNDGRDSLLGTNGDDTLIGYDKDESINVGDSEGDDLLFGGGGEDHIFGGRGNDTIRGEAGADTLIGSNDEDSMVGGIGDDLLIGSVGPDTVSGGSGSDIFQYTGLDGLSAIEDLILDLEDIDTIDLLAIDADTQTSGDQAFTIVPEFTGAAGELRVRYDSGLNRTFIELNVDGDAGIEMTIRADGDHTDFTSFIL